MNIYIDKVNLYSLIKDWYKYKDIYTLDLLRNECILIINCSKDELINDPDIIHFMDLLITQGVRVENQSPAFSASKLPKRPLDNELHKNKLYRNSLLFLDDKQIPEFKKLGYFICSEIGEEYDILQSIFLKQKKLHLNPTLRNEVINWNYLNQYQKPLSEIIIVDRHLVDANENDIRFNLQPLLGSLLATRKQIINITLFTWEDKKWNFIALSKLIRDMINKITYNKCNFTLITSDKKKSIEKSEIISHDRNIFTNYIRILLNDSIPNHFTSNGIYTNCEDLNIYSLADRNYFTTASNILNRFQEQISKKQFSVQGDKISNYFTY